MKRHMAGETEQARKDLERLAIVSAYRKVIFIYYSSHVCIKLYHWYSTEEQALLTACQTFV
jgi:Leu/Phe-tRNA-protein transferase